MRFAACTLIVAVALCSAARADDTEDARQLYERGMAHFQLAEYDDAIARWQEGFRRKPVPEFLFNLGQAYRLSNRADKAMQAYKAYLRMAPSAANRDEVERYLDALVRKLDEAAKRPASAPPAVSSTAPAGNALVATAPPRARRRPWIWGVVAGGVVVVAGAVVLGVVLGTRDGAHVLPELHY